jgi:hypothetical protein
VPPEEPPDQTEVAAATARSFSMLLESRDLPGAGWEVTEERSWPTGTLDPSSAKSRRATVEGGITAWRKFGHPHPANSAWVEVVPYATTEDAELSLRQVPAFFVGVSAPGDTVVDEHVVVDHQVPGVHRPWVYQKLVKGPEGEVVTRIVVGAVDRILVLVSMTGPEAPGAWHDVLGLAGAQIAAVRRALAA